MAAHQWNDPLLITDVCSQQQFNSQDREFADPLAASYSSGTSTSVMEELDPIDFTPGSIQDNSSPKISLERTSAEISHDDIMENVTDGRAMLGFSLTSPDLVICAGSPDIPTTGISINSYEDSSDCLKGSSTVVVSLENGIKGSETYLSVENPKVEEPSTFWKATTENNVSQEAYFELPHPPLIDKESPERTMPLISINVGSSCTTVLPGGVKFSEDMYFTGGDTTTTNISSGESERGNLYQSARFGNFAYNFKIRPGFYKVDLHFAEIEFHDGPRGMRVFDVYIQGQKVISSLDIYARVGGNMPLVISDIKSQVEGDEGLLIKFEGVNGNPIVCGISVNKDSIVGSEEADVRRLMGSSKLTQCKSFEEVGNGTIDKDFCRSHFEHKCQEKELINTKQALAELKKENEIKNRECQEAWRSLKDLQNELMRKSMHVGSLAFAIEGQVKEKSRWFSSLRDLTRKLKILKMDHIKLAEEASSYKKFLADIDDINSVIQSKLKEHLQIHEDLKTRFNKGAKTQKELYNKVLELKGNIRVFCRCRPLNSEEISAGASIPIDFEASKDGELTIKSTGLPKKTFKFDAVFSPQARQDDVFEDTAPFATSVLDGYNVCIFAYGQTGTGKTFTMEGTDEARGVNYRTLDKLFHIIEERKNTFHYDISVSVLEVYNEQIRDLLVCESQPGLATKRLEIKQVSEGIHHVPGLVEAHVNNMEEVWEVLQTGNKGRAVGSTSSNEHSSRSHCIHCVMVKGENLLNGESTRSKLWLIDLAGSERIAKTEVQGERLKETQNINRSLSALGDVISALANKSPHIPFRNSKLTHLLQDSLGGDSKTLMFVQISPNENDLSETLCSLNFASRVRGIELGPVKRQVESTELLKCKQMIEKTKQEMKSKDFQVKKLEDTIHGLDIRIKEKDIRNKNLQDKIKELESQLLVERKLARQHVDTKIAEQQQYMKEQEDEENHDPIRPVLSAKTMGSSTRTFAADQVNIARPLSENNYYKLPSVPSLEGFTKHRDFMEKENDPEMVEQLQMIPPPPKRTGRASICPAAQRIPAAQLPRRNSLIPLPSLVPVTTTKLLPSSFTSLAPTIQAAETTEEMANNGGGSNCCCPSESPKVVHDGGMGGKKLSSSSRLLRKSFQKKTQRRSPMLQQQQQQHIRRIGVNVGMEKVRVSIGSRGKIMAHRVLSNARRVTKETQLKESKREKERGWNIGTAAPRTVL